MYLRFSDRARYENLHLSTALEDWDMMEELKQFITIDQYFAVIGTGEKVDQSFFKRQNSMQQVTPCGSEEGSPEENKFKPTPWLIVNPNLVMPCPEVYDALPPEPQLIPSHKFTPPGNRKLSSVDYSTMEDSEEEALTSSSELCNEEDHCFIAGISPARMMRVKCHVKKGHIPRNRTKLESWPRPPINYCNLISLALRNSADGSLNVQQIYSFVREQFPFFRAAPDGWKNTVRHNLCFSSSFEKSADWVCADGHRRSCLWKLTRQGRRKFHAEMHALSDELLRVLRRSMNKPALMELMFGI